MGSSKFGPSQLGLDYSISGFIAEMCSRFGPRLSGTAAEAKAAEFIGGELKATCDEVVVEEHLFSPRSIDWSVTFYLIVYWSALLMCPRLPAFSFIILSVSLAIFFLSRLRGYEILERFYPHEKTQNVTGKLKPIGETARKIIFSGHHDSAYYMPLFEKRLLKFTMAAFFFLIACHAFLLLAALLRMAAPVGFLRYISSVLFTIAAAGGVLFVPFRLFLYKNVGVLGANDNLAGVGVAIAAARYFAANRPEGVEVWFSSFGAEEAGLRGSKRFAKRHWSELQDAIVVNLEMVGAGKMIIVAGERMAGTRHSPEAVSLIRQAARNCGIEMTILSGLFGETDASSFTRAGIKAATIAALDEKGIPPNWHVLSDTPENIDEGHLENALRVCIECVAILERSCANGAGEKAQAPKKQAQAQVFSKTAR